MFLTDKDSINRIIANVQGNPLLTDVFLNSNCSSLVIFCSFCFILFYLNRFYSSLTIVFKQKNFDR